MVGLVVVPHHGDGVGFGRPSTPHRSHVRRGHGCRGARAGARSHAREQGRRTRTSDGGDGRCSARHADDVALAPSVVRAGIVVAVGRACTWCRRTCVASERSFERTGPADRIHDGDAFDAHADGSDAEDGTMAARTRTRRRKEHAASIGAERWTHPHAAPSGGSVERVRRTRVVAATSVRQAELRGNPTRVEHRTASCVGRTAATHHFRCRRHALRRRTSHRTRRRDHWTRRGTPAFRRARGHRHRCWISRRRHQVPRKNTGAAGGLPTAPPAQSNHRSIPHHGW
mmetsp:Transcript_8423/g.52655  ORF Transcript_8423/g.52655 Transcript_8423/m.52655 type:complete len:285 (+) Transcript_8423:2680-3534(+)